jgi:hypothetical protein
MQDEDFYTKVISARKGSDREKATGFGGSYELKLIFHTGGSRRA